MQNESSRIAKRKIKMKNQHRYNSYVLPMYITRSLLVEGILGTSSGLNLTFFKTCFPILHFAETRGNRNIKIWLNFVISSFLERKNKDKRGKKCC